MKHSILVSLLFLLFLIPNSCKKEPICACSVEHPEKNIPWLKDFLSKTTYANVYKLEIDGLEYIICTRVPGLDAVSLVFDCEGNLLCKAGAEYIRGKYLLFSLTFLGFLLSK
jgi:hypothetical protein